MIIPRLNLRVTESEFVGWGPKSLLKICISVYMLWRLLVRFRNHWCNLLCDYKQYCMYIVDGFILWNFHNPFSLSLFYSPVISCRQILLRSIPSTSFWGCYSILKEGHASCECYHAVILITSLLAGWNTVLFEFRSENQEDFYSSPLLNLIPTVISSTKRVSRQNVKTPEASIASMTALPHGHTWTSLLMWSLYLRQPILSLLSVLLKC